MAKSIVSVKGDQSVLAYLAKALGSKAGGREIGDRDLITSGLPFTIEAMIHVRLTGNVSEDSTQNKPLGFKWLEMLSLLLAMMGATRNTARKLLALTVEWQHALRRAAAGDSCVTSSPPEPLPPAKFPDSDPARPDELTTEQQAWIRHYVRDVVYTDEPNLQGQAVSHNIPAYLVGQLAAQAAAKVAEIEDLQDHYARQLMTTMPLRGQVRFDEIVTEVATFAANEQRQEA